jgi:hypothetical protein
MSARGVNDDVEAAPPDRKSNACLIGTNVSIWGSLSMSRRSEVMEAALCWCVAAAKSVVSEEAAVPRDRVDFADAASAEFAKDLPNEVVLSVVSTFAGSLVAIVVRPKDVR